MTTAQRTAIESLLEELQETRRRIYVAKTYGVRRAGMRDLKDDIRSTKRRLRAQLSV
ncbi:MAG TPA: hypothetical protein VIK66_07630 [Gaiellaceae bacterium]|jgi:hypothetical protein